MRESPEYPIAAQVKNGTACVVRVRFREGKQGLELSFNGDVYDQEKGPPNARSDRGLISCGQCQNGIRETLGEAITPEMARVCELWDSWHLNGMRAGCEHQRAASWNICPGHYPKAKDKETFMDTTFEPIFFIPKGRVLITNCNGEPEVIVCETYKVSTYYQGSFRCSLDMLSKPCTVCGYKFGSAWLYEPIPPKVVAEVIGFISGDLRFLAESFIANLKAV